MKTENNPGDSVWANNVELLPNEESLPVIGSCQVSSILSTLDTSVADNTQNMDLIILPNNDFKIPIVENFQTNYLVLKENGSNKSDKSKAAFSAKGKQNDFKDMLYFVCNMCPFLCTKDSKINEHIENAHKNKPVRKLPQFKCPACSNIFFHKLSLRSHLIHDHGVGRLDLSLIMQAVVYYSNKNSKISEQSVKKHQSKSELTSVKILEEHEDDDDDGSIDGEDFADNTEIAPKIKNLLLDADKPNTKNGEIDGKSSLSEPIVKFGDSKKIHKCILPTCKVRLQNIDKLNYHIDTHTENGFKCLECDETFSFWKPLTGHLWRLHKIDMELYACDKCDYKTFSLSKLNNIHKLIHGDIKAYVCEVCEKGFKNSKQLRNHKITHKRKLEKVFYICEVCLKSFADRRQLKVHMDVVHNKIKPYLCNYCGYKGSSKSSLKMHIRQHTGEKPFACDFCSYTTSDHNSLRRHKLRHTGQKPYKCAHCSYACIQSSTYKVHLKTKHPGLEKDLMFTCHECQFRSVNKDMYTSHMVTVHKQKPQASQTIE